MGAKRIESSLADPEKLLAHADFVRGLARRLVRDEHDGADISQETWSVALRHPPENRADLQSWIAAVMRNFLRRLRRTQERRVKRERSAARPERVPSAAEIVEREEIRLRVVEAVFELEEPYHSAIVLRFYEDLTSREAADRLGVPAATMRTRIRRGLELLRGRLDDVHGGDRTTWCLALAPLVGLKLSLSHTAAAASLSAGASVVGGSTSGSVSAATLFSGGTATAAKLKLCIAATVVLAASAVVWQVLPDKNESSGLGNRDGVESNSSRQIENTRSERGASPARNVAAEETSARVAIDPSGIILSGRIVDGATGEPVRSFDFLLREYSQKVGDPDLYHEIVHDPSGCFSFPLKEAGDYNLTIRSADYMAKRIRRLNVPEPRGMADLQIPLEKGESLSGRVVDDLSGDPIKGALVIPERDSGKRPLLRTREREDRSLAIMLVQLGKALEGFPNGVTDDDGGFSLEGLPAEPQSVTALHPDHVAASIDIKPPEQKAVEIRLKKGFHVFGTARDDSGRPVPGILIEVRTDAVAHNQPALTDSAGRYRTAPIASGAISVIARQQPWPDQKSPDFTREIRNVEIVDSDLRIDFGPSPEHVTLKGRVLNYDGQPLARTTLRFSSDKGYPWKGSHVALSRSASSDGEGLYEVKKLLTGRYCVTLQLPGCEEYVGLNRVTLKTSGIVERDLRIDGNVLGGWVIDGGTGRPIGDAKGWVNATFHEGNKESHFSAHIDEQSRFCFLGIPAGIYTLEVQGTSNADSRIFDVEVKEGDVIEDFKIVLSPAGFVHIRSPNLKKWNSDIDFSFIKDGGARSAGTLRFSDDGTHDNSYRLAVGDYTMTLEFEGLGLIEKKFQIVAHETTEVILSDEDLSFDWKRVALSGSLTRPDRSPVAKETIRFIPFKVPGYEKRSSHYKRVDTDEQGRFHVTGFRPGIWSIRIHHGHATWEYPDLYIPADADDPFSLNLILPHGGVRGTLCDGLTGQPLSEASPGWHVSVKGTGARQPACTQGGRATSAFELFGVAEGEYRLWVRPHEGYEKFVSDPFFLVEGQRLEFGDVLLQPIGTLVIEVVDTKGEKIKYAAVTCEDPPLPRDSAKGVLSGEFRFEGLRFGTIHLLISAKDYIEKPVSADIVPGRPSEVRVVLENKE